MDPISLTALGLGAASLTFQLFAGCIKGFVLLSTAHNIGRDSSTLLCMLNLQEIQLTEWARSAGLLSQHGKLDIRLNETVVHATLKELQDLLLNTEKLKTRYKLGLVAVSSTTQDDVDRTASPAAHSILSQAISDDLRGDIMYRAQLIHSRNSFPQRLWWAAVDKTKFEELIERVKSFIRELWYLLDPIRQSDVSQSLRLVLSHVIAMSEKVDELSSLHETLLGSSNTLVTSLSMPNNTRELLASAAEVKKIQMDIDLAEEHDKSTFFNTAMHQRLGLAPPSSLLSCNTDHINQYKQMKNNPDLGTATYAGYKDGQIFVEWKSLPIHFRSKVIERAEDLASLLSAPKHPDFRSLQCIGIARDNDAGKIAFIFKTPPSNASQLPRSLRYLFGLSPSVTERVRLALQITQSVKYFHTAGWLHKNLRSENVLFWHNNTSLSGTISPLMDPVLVGFTFSRQDSPSQISEQPSSDPQRDIYRHPDAMGEPSVSFTAAKDIYALGTVLLEIGEWRSLRSLVEKVVDVSKTDAPTEQLAKVKPFLLDEGPKGGLGMLKFRMGEVYAKVTKMMLSGEVPATPEAQEGAGIVFRPGLLDTAITELERCVI